MHPQATTPDRSEISDAEHAVVHDCLGTVIEAINITAHREQHIGICCHALMLGLEPEQRAQAFSYLYRVLLKEKH
jgi:hypothetical protein